MPDTFADWFHQWTERRQFHLGLVFCLIMGAAVSCDITMVTILHTDSISWRTWVATEAHPTLIAAGMLFTIFCCWLVRSSWVLVMFMGVMGGHLFVHW